VSSGGEPSSGGIHPLLTDLYELTMLHAYWNEGLQADAVFSLFFRRLPESRN
jgi:nicotinate phosphoribosyltransferase